MPGVPLTHSISTYLKFFIVRSRDTLRVGVRVRVRVRERVSVRVTIYYYRLSLTAS
jgi:hypothetical protein